LSYGQMHETDGYIPMEAMPIGSRKAQQSLVLRKLWEPDPRGGMRIHDYTDWNNSKEFIRSKRESARQRMANVRANTSQRTTSELTPKNKSSGSGANVLLGLALSSSEREHERKPLADARSKRPIFTGQRLVVFEWMLDDIRQILGPYFEDFYLDEWFLALDAQAMRMNLVIPKRDQGKWLQAQLVEEAARRGLKIAGSEADPYADLPTAWQCKHCGDVHEGTQEQGRKGVCLRPSA